MHPKIVELARQRCQRALIAEGVRRAAWSAIELLCECRAIGLVGADISHELHARELLSLADRIESGEEPIE